jgi:alkaline phosphatase D
MNLNKIILIILFCYIPFFCSIQLNAQENLNLSFGSCLTQKKDMGILKSIHTFSPQYFIFMGDNIYKDTYNIEEKISEYNGLGENPDFQILRKKTKILATWDDHDYGVNDAGEEYPVKKESQREFTNFFYPKDIEARMKKEGVYSSEIIYFKKLKLHIILLDTRFFRTELKRQNLLSGGYVPNYEEKATLLGSKQWDWLESELGVEADLKIIVTSIQFYNEDHPFEKWGNFPLEKKKFFNMVERGKFKHLILLSGDRHLSESFGFQTPNGKQVYEITSSPLNKELPIKLFFSKREDRLGDVLMDSSFGNMEAREENGIYTFQFSYILKNLEKINLPIHFSIQKK